MASEPNRQRTVGIAMVRTMETNRCHHRRCAKSDRSRRPGRAECASGSGGRDGRQRGVRTHSGPLRREGKGATPRSRHSDGRGSGCPESRSTKQRRSNRERLPRGDAAGTLGSRVPVTERASVRTRQKAGVRRPEFERSRTDRTHAVTVPTAVGHHALPPRRCSTERGKRQMQRVWGGVERALRPDTDREKME